MLQLHRTARSPQSRFFAFVQDTGWYREFLLPVVTALADLPPPSRVLDIGTGPGRLLALVQQELALQCVGVDVDPAMLAEARRLPDLSEVALVHVPVGQTLPFPPQTFDAICFCSVLYLLDPAAVDSMLHGAKQLLRPHGRMVILTPSGAPPSRREARFHHWTFAVWRHLTAAAAHRWHTAHLASAFAQREAMTYACQSEFADLATIEILTTG
jgi:ubiquinone/menaquinone biosynthesis C-methylase UbiE